MNRQNSEPWVAAVGVALMPALGGCSVHRKAAEQRFLESLGDTSITVFPAFVRRQEGSYDEHSAARLSEFFGAAGLAQATPSTRHVPITGPWRMNQSRMWRDSARQFGEYVRTDPIDTRYALLPEYLAGRIEAVGIHAYIVDAEGAVVFAVLLNSHWPEFQRAKPKTPDECTGVLVDVLRQRLKTTVNREK